LSDILDDLLSESLQIVFCGTAASTTAAKVGAYYAHPQNKFWKTLHEARFTSDLLQPHQYRDLLTYRIGLTDLVKAHFGMDHQLPKSQLGEIARTRLHASIEAYRPKFLAFTSKTAGQKFLGGAREYGEQVELIGETRIWILPSTSGAANGAWRPEVWRRFAEVVRG
jgi:TDG/mug DNA glycosylase family protein